MAGAGQKRRNSVVATRKKRKEPCSSLDVQTLPGEIMVKRELGVLGREISEVTLAVENGVGLTTR